MTYMYDKVADLSMQRIDYIRDISGDKIPLYRYPNSLEWKFSNSGSWTGGLYCAIQFLRDSSKSLPYIISLIPKLKNIVEIDSVNRFFVYYYLLKEMPAHIYIKYFEKFSLINYLAPSFDETIGAFPVGMGMGGGGGNRIYIDTLAPILGFFNKYDFDGGSQNISKIHLDTTLKILRTKDGGFYTYASYFNKKWYPENGHDLLRPREEVWGILGLAYACKYYGLDYFKATIESLDYWIKKYSKLDSKTAYSKTDLSAYLIYIYAILILFPNEKNDWTSIAEELLDSIVLYLYNQNKESKEICNLAFPLCMYSLTPEKIELVEMTWPYYFLIKDIILYTKRRNLK